LVLLLKKEYWPKKIYSELKRGESDAKLLPRSFIVALKIIAHLRDFDRITYDNLRKICKGTHLRQHTRDEVLQALKKLKLIRKERGRDVYIKQGKKLF